MENLEKEVKVVRGMKTVTEGAFENADCDYPAAHSMDTTWFAVDRDGFVAMLVTNEEGALPLASQEDQGDGMEFLEDLSAHTGRELQLGDYEFPLPESLGLFGYEWPLGEFPEGCELSEDELCDMQESDGLPSPYKRSAVPTAPLKIDDLPPNLQKKLKGLVFSEVSFAGEEWLQPAMHLPCEFWASGDVKIMDVDGCIKPVPEELKTDGSKAKEAAAGDPSESVRNLPWWQRLFKN